MNQKAVSICHWLQANPLTGLKDCYVAYSSVTIVYDPVSIRKNENPDGTVFEWVSEKLHEAINYATIVDDESRRVVEIPVCYDQDLGTDLEALAAAKQLSIPEIIEIHHTRTYKVYMLGFLPGFTYMGEVDERLIVPRKPQPVPVAGGSVGVVSFQTGIYPLNSPGGWHIIGRTPVRLFNKDAEDPVLLHAGDEVKFYPIGREEYEYKCQMKNEEFEMRK